MTARAVLIALAAFAGAAAAQPQELDGDRLRTMLRGKYVTDDHHWAHHYLADGRLTRVDKGRVKPGRWAVQGHRLCLSMPELSAEAVCYSVRRNGDELLYLDARGYAVWQGFVRDKAHTPLFDGVRDPPAR